jgi:hypothetical protein
MVDYIMIAVLGVGVFLTAVGIGVIKRDRKQKLTQHLSFSFSTAQPNMVAPEVVKSVQETEKTENGKQSLSDIASKAVAFFKKEEP